VFFFLEHVFFIKRDKIQSETTRTDLPQKKIDGRTEF